MLKAANVSTGDSVPKPHMFTYGLIPSERR